jgi:signal transduction histidine kinase
MTGALVTRWPRTVAGLSVVDVALAAGLAALVLAIGAGAVHTSGARASFAAAAGVLFMTVPVAFRRRWPLAVAAGLAVAALLNGLIFGQVVRCGVALPVILLVGFSVAARYGRRTAAAGLLVCAAAVVAEGLSDPQIEGQGLPFVLPLLAAFFAAGRLVRSRSEVAAALRDQSAALRRQREQTARLAVLADRAQLSAELDGTLHARLGDLASTAAAGLAALDTGTGDARQVMADIERDGRAALGEMREILGTLQDAPSEPQPRLADLPGLLARVTTASARLTVEGSPRVLSAGLELTGCRLVEHLIQALEDSPDAAIDVRLSFRPDALELHVSGPRSAGSDLQAILAAAAERAALHSGTVQHRLAGATCHAVAWLPLISDYQ